MARFKRLNPTKIKLKPRFSDPNNLRKPSEISGLGQVNLNPAQFIRPIVIPITIFGSIAIGSTLTRSINQTNLQRPQRLLLKSVIPIVAITGSIFIDNQNVQDSLQESIQIVLGPVAIGSLIEIFTEFQ